MNDSCYDYFDVTSNPKRPTDDYWGDYDPSKVYVGDEWKKEHYGTDDHSGPKCECGALKTYGDLCPPEYHSSYCPLYKKI